MRSLQRTHWVEASIYADTLSPLDGVGASFLRLQLHLLRGEAKEMEALLGKMEREKKMEEHEKARLLVLEAEWFCLCSNYASESMYFLCWKNEVGFSCLFCLSKAWLRKYFENIS